MVRRNVEKAKNDEIETRLRDVHRVETRTVDLVFHFLPITHEGPVDPIPWQHHPRNNAKDIPSQVHQRGLGIPQTLPEVGFLECVEDVKILDGNPRGWTSVLLRTSVVEQIRRHWDPNYNECRPQRSAEFVRGRSRV